MVNTKQVRIEYSDYKKLIDYQNKTKIPFWKIIKDHFKWEKLK